MGLKRKAPPDPQKSSLSSQDRPGTSPPTVTGMNWEQRCMKIVKFQEHHCPVAAGRQLALTVALRNHTEVVAASVSPEVKNLRCGVVRGSCLPAAAWLLMFPQRSAKALVDTQDSR
ncbi:hypothetical protein AAFF_G00078630 [Aldrovandia affinis]|uniref:Uncharacterized protein n=1 Tax=Aldrovandia affinis TaxID=143900 RepID=A0AAD7RXD3_9TELE|nr:hypothetical protein AAFF_G00078630 [Aldrovandia affinis]